MKLRDGRFYTPVESKHMILRDGKSVDAAQAYIFNETYYCSIHGRVKFHDSVYAKYERAQSWRKISILSTTVTAENNLDNDSHVEKVKKREEIKCGNDETASRNIKSFGHCHYECVGLQKDKKIESSFLTRIQRQFVPYLGFFVLLTSKYLVTSPFSFLKNVISSLVVRPFIWLVLASITIGRTASSAIIFTPLWIFSMVSHIANLSFVKLGAKVLQSVSITVRNCFKKIYHERDVMTVRKVRANTNLSINQRMNWLAHVWRLCKIMMYAFPVILFFILLWSFVRTNHTTLNPVDVGLKNGRQILMNGSHDIPAWHIIPETATHFPITEAFNDKSPVLLLVRDNGYLDSYHRVEIFQSLSTLGFHILAPIFPLSHDQIIDAWSYVKNKGQSSTVYLWVDYMDVDLVKKYAHSMCGIGMPPSGIIIETSIKNELNNVRNLGISSAGCGINIHEVRSLEIWSSKCETVNGYQKYNFLKCPVTSQIDNVNLLDEVSSCMRAIGKDTSFRAR